MVRAFKRWACDQLVFCYRYGVVYPKVALLWQPLLFKALNAGDVDGFRSIYDCMLQDCVSVGVITPDDRNVFRHTYPTFDPAYITYEYAETAFRDKMSSFLATAFAEFNGWNYYNRYGRLLTLTGGATAAVGSNAGTSSTAAGPVSTRSGSSGWVSRPGVQLVMESKLTPQGAVTLDGLNIADGEDDVRIADAMARVTYLSFPVAVAVRG